jgi:hypothetical protein
LYFRIWHEQFRMRELVHAKAAARPAGALRVVEDEVLRGDVPVNEVVRRAAEPFVEPFRVRLARPLHDVGLQQPVAHQKRAGDPCLDRLLVLSAHHEPVHDGVDVPGVV